MITLQELVDIINDLNIKLDKFSINDLMTGYNIELEHGTVNPSTNITNDNKIMTVKIALAHLNEYPNYYNKEFGLPALENYLKNKEIGT